MADPITDIVTLLQPGAPFTKRASGAGSWIVRRVEFGRPFYAVVLDGACRLEASGHEPLRLDAGDFVLIPTASDFSMSSPEPLSFAAHDAEPEPEPEAEPEPAAARPALVMPEIDADPDDDDREAGPLPAADLRALRAARAEVNIAALQALADRLDEIRRRSSRGAGGHGSL